MAEFKVLILDNRYESYNEEKSVLKKIGAEVLINASENEDEIADLVGDVDGVIVNLANITSKIISSMKQCKCISRYGVGYDNIDIEALKGTDIYLANVPDYCGEDVSDHAFALFMDCVRKISRKDRHVRKGEWNLAGIQPVYRICGKTFGFVGYGMIAKFFHRKLSGFNLGKVLVADPFVEKNLADEFGVELVDLETLCKESDYISLHAPVLPLTKGMMGAEQFELMKTSAILINTARGHLVDESALVDALKTGKIACAGLDVFINEPLELESELRRLDNVTITDHASWYSEESIIELKTKAAQNIASVLTAGKPVYSVKF